MDLFRINRFIWVLSDAVPLPNGLEEDLSFILRQLRSSCTVVVHDIRTSDLCSRNRQRSLDELFYQFGNMSNPLTLEAPLKCFEELDVADHVHKVGLIVADTNQDPQGIIEYACTVNLDSLDLILDSPVGDVVLARWVISLFDEWLKRASHIPFVFFENIQKRLTYSTDVFRSQSLSELWYCSDGSISHSSILGLKDVYKLPSVKEMRLSDAYRALLWQADILVRHGLCTTCRQCKWVNICQGGIIKHRFRDQSFDYPSKYCDLYQEVISHVKKDTDRLLIPVLIQKNNDTRLASSDLVHRYVFGKDCVSIISSLWSNVASQQKRRLLELIGSKVSLQRDDVIQAVNRKLGSWFSHPATALFLTYYKKNPESDFDASFITRELPDIDKMNIHRNVKWLRELSSSQIVFESDPSAIQTGKRLVKEAKKIISSWSPDYYSEFCTLVKEIQFMRDKLCEPHKNSAFTSGEYPGAIYLSISSSRGFITPIKLAESLIHESLHIKLDLFMSYYPVFKYDYPLVDSPWKTELRPPSGLLHAVFVFQIILEYWIWVCQNGYWEKAQQEIDHYQTTLPKAMFILEGCALNDTGRLILDALKNRFKKIAGLASGEVKIECV